jgi:hypothetical protein
MTTFTTDDRQDAEKEPVPFFGWVDKEDTEQMLRDQLHAQQHEIDRLNVELMKATKEKE